MNVDIIKGRWKQLGAGLKTQWAKPGEDDSGLAEDHREYLVGRLQERYGWATDRAKAEVARFESELASADEDRPCNGQGLLIFSSIEQRSRSDLCSQKLDGVCGSMGSTAVDHDQLKLHQRGKRHG